MIKLEKEIEAALVRAVEAHGGLCLKWVCPGWSGVPDRIILLPGGHVLFAETKRPRGGRVSPLQRWWCKRLTALGFYSVYIHDEADIRTLDLVMADEAGR